jgi:hypothetical protein
MARDVKLRAEVDMLRAEVDMLRAELAAHPCRMAMLSVQAQPVSGQILHVSARPVRAGPPSVPVDRPDPASEARNDYAEAAIKLQALHRGKAARKATRTPQLRNNKAATQIQSAARGRQARLATSAAFDRAVAVGAKLQKQEEKAELQIRGQAVRRAAKVKRDDAPLRLSSVVGMAMKASAKLKVAVDEDGDGQVSVQVRRAVLRQVRRRALLTAAILKGRSRRWLRRNEMAMAVVSVLYLGLVFMQIVMEEVPLTAQAEEDALAIFSTVDLAFLIIFSIEIVMSLLAYGRKYFASRLLQVDAATVVASLALASLERAGVINTRLEIMRLFRLLRLVKVAIALQRVRLRTSNWRKMSVEVTRQPPTCNWAKARRIDPSTGKAIRNPETKKYAAFLSHYKLEAHLLLPARTHCPRHRRCPPPAQPGGCRRALPRAGAGAGARCPTLPKQAHPPLQCIPSERTCGAARC